MKFPRVSTLKTAAAFRDHLAKLGVALPLDEVVETGADAPLAKPFSRMAGTIGNRFAILPMEGWDGTSDGRPSDLTRRRWRNFGLSGAKLIWGGEAVAVRHDGRANPNQLLLNDDTLADIASLREELLLAHRQQFHVTDDLLVGLQLTHSGRFARPNDKRRLEPRIMYRHPYLDSRVGVQDDKPLLSDDEIARLTEDFVRAAQRARKAGFAFIDVKHCHGYLGHEFLSSVDRPGRYGGSLENRTRFLRNIVAGVRAEAAGLEIGIRVSVFDFIPFQTGPTASASRPPLGRPTPMRSEATARVWASIWRSRPPFSICWRSWGSISFARPWAAPTTTHTSSGRPRSRRRMGTCRRKTLWSASQGKSRSRRN